MQRPRPSLRLRFLPVLAAIALLPSCENTTSKDFLGSAVVEVQTYQVAATVQGQIVATYKDEGSPVQAGELVAVIDTVPMVLKLAELDAMVVELYQNITARKGDLKALESDIGGAKRERDRLAGLVQQGSAPKQQLDLLSTQYESAALKLDAGAQSVSALAVRRRTLDAQRAQILDNIRRCYVRSPCSGMVLTQYKNRGEVAGPASPLFEIGAYDTAQVDFFVPQPVLAQIKLGQGVRIRIDAGRGSFGKQPGEFVPATITWISNDAEFSPKNIQTRESRNELVFRVRAKTTNAGGKLKRGLPVEVWK